MYCSIFDIDTCHKTSYKIITMLLLQIYCVCALTVMQCMAAKGVLGVKILTSKFFSGGMLQLGMLMHASKHYHTMSDQL